MPTEAGAAPATGGVPILGTVAPGRFSPALLVASEMTWISLCLSAVANTAPKFEMDIPYLALALPAALSALIAAAISRLPAKMAVRLGLAAFSSLVLTSIGAGLLASFSIHGAFAAVAFHPWTVTGRVPSATSALAWFAVSLGVVRGDWLGLLRGSFRQIGRSAAVTGVFLLTLLVVLATSSDPRLKLATRGVPVLLVVFFVEALALGRLMRVREEEAEGLAGEGAAQRRLWTALLAVPLLVVLGVALVVSVAARAFGHGIGVGARGAGRGIAFAVTEVARGFSYLIVHLAIGIVDAIGAIVGLFYHHKINDGPVHKTTTTTTLAHSATLPGAPLGVAIGIGAVLFLGLVLLFWRHRPRRERPERVKTPPQTVESLFSWGHLISILYQWAKRGLARAWRRLRPRAHHLEPPRFVPPGVRGEYQRLLEAAAAAGWARATPETAREFAERLAPALEGLEAELETLTAEYERVRYAEGTEAAVLEPSAASELTAMLVAALAANAEEAESSEPGDAPDELPTVASPAGGPPAAGVFS